MKATSQTPYPRISRGARFLALASVALAIVGFIISSIWNGDTASETAVSDFGWTLLNLSTVAGVVFLAVFAVSLIREESRADRALRVKEKEAAELRASRGRLVAAGDAARRQIERDLHDGVQPRLVALLLNVKLARRAAEPGGATAPLDEIEQELGEILRELRTLASGILPPALTDLGLEAAVTELTAKMPFRVEVLVSRQRLPAPVEVTAYFLIAESLTNAAKHAKASRVKVSMDVVNGHAVVQVDDDGVGGADSLAGSGLRGLADRVDTLEGRFSITSRDGAGTTIRAEMPCGS